MSDYQENIPDADWIGNDEPSLAPVTGSAYLCCYRDKRLPPANWVQAWIALDEEAAKRWMANAPIWYERGYWQLPIMPND